MKVGDEVRTAIALPGIPAGTRGVVKEIGRPFVVVAFADGRHGYYARRQLMPTPPRGRRPPARASESTPLGLDDVRVPKDSHMCLLASSDTACVSVVTRYATAGLNSSETLAFFMPEKARTAFLRDLSHRGIDTEAAIDGRQLTIVHPSNIYLPARQFDPAKQLSMVEAFASKATQEAPNGLRCCGFVGRMYKAKGWWQYEHSLTRLLKDYRIITMCVYDGSAKRAGIAGKLHETHTHVLRDAVITQGGAEG
jgi:hypothetical protein